MCLPQLLSFLYNSVYNTALMLKLLLLKSIQFNSTWTSFVESIISGLPVMLDCSQYGTSRLKNVADAIVCACKELLRNLSE